MKSERELLTLAAKAMGIDLESYIALGNVRSYMNKETGENWTSLHDDGDCARLEAALGLDVVWYRDHVVSVCHDDEGRYVCSASEDYTDHNGDKNKARRWASTRAAAAVAEEMNHA